MLTITLSGRSVKTHNSNNTVDCIGPDGKHLRLVQQACDQFNNAWHNSPPTPTTGIVLNALQQYGQDSLKASCYQDEHYCLQPAYETSVVCVNICGSQANLDNQNCTGSSTEESCLSESSTKMETCDTNCQNQYHDAINKCNSPCN